MLEEITKGLRREGERTRRWYTDPEFDLYVWTGAGEDIQKFQICVGDLAVTWETGAEMLYDTIPRARGYRTPLLRPTGPFDLNAIRCELGRRMGGLDASTARFLLDRLGDEIALRRQPLAVPQGARLVSLFFACKEHAVLYVLAPPSCAPDTLRITDLVSFDAHGGVLAVDAWTRYQDTLTPMRQAQLFAGHLEPLEVVGEALSKMVERADPRPASVMLALRDHNPAAA